MKKMMVAAMLAFGLCNVNVAVAQTSASGINSLDVQGLTPEQKTQLLAQAVEFKKQAGDPANASENVRKEVEQWTNLGGNMGRAAVAAAKELGIAANEFVETPLGKVTMAVVIYKVMGQELLHIFFGGFIFLTTIATSFYLYRKKAYHTATYEERPVLFGLFHKQVLKSYTVSESTRDMYTSFALWIMAAGTAISLVTVFTA